MATVRHPLLGIVRAGLSEQQAASHVATGWIKDETILSTGVTHVMNNTGSDFALSDMLEQPARGASRAAWAAYAASRGALPDAMDDLSRNELRFRYGG